MLVKIVLREDFGTNGRDGYFDEYGVIRPLGSPGATSQPYFIISAKCAIGDVPTQLSSLCTSSRVVIALTPLRPHVFCLHSDFVSNGSAGKSGISKESYSTEL
ncbi:hypothetical protein KSS87_000049, partial [Heliosperma pusillum]